MDGPVPLGAQRKFLITVGVSAYVDDQIQDLPRAAEDAERVQRLLVPMRCCCLICRHCRPGRCRFGWTYVFAKFVPATLRKGAHREHAGQLQRESGLPDRRRHLSRSTNVTDRIIRCAEADVTPGEVRRVEIALDPTAHRFVAVHRIRLQLRARRQQAEFRWALGLTQNALGNHDQARTSWQRSITILQDIGP
jgi:hypothetical protein